MTTVRCLHSLALLLIGLWAALHWGASAQTAPEHTPTADTPWAVAVAGHTKVGTARRIISLAPHLTELVYAAGAGARLVAVSRYSDQPEAARNLPIVSDAFAINLEAVRAQRPDLVLLWRSGTAQRQRQALLALAQREGFAVIDTEIRSVPDIAQVLAHIGTWAGTQAQAASQAQALLTQWAALGQRYRQAVPVRVFFQLWDAPLMTLNSQHLINQALGACGAVNGFAHLAPLTPTVSREAVLAFNPQLIVTDQPAPEQALAAWRALPQIEAVQRNQLKGLRGDALTRMGPRFVQAAEQLCALIDAARPSVPR